MWRTCPYFSSVRCLHGAINFGYVVTPTEQQYFEVDKRLSQNQERLVLQTQEYNKLKDDLTKLCKCLRSWSWDLMPSEIWLQLYKLFCFLQLRNWKLWKIKTRSMRRQKRNFHQSRWRYERAFCYLSIQDRLVTCTQMWDVCDED